MSQRKRQQAHNINVTFDCICHECEPKEFGAVVVKRSRCMRKDHEVYYEWWQSVRASNP